MSEELQGLLNRIRQDGLAKAENEQEKILAEAKQKAEAIIAEAKAAADQLTRQAQSDAKAAEEKAQAAIRQASRDVLIALKEEILARMTRLTKACAGQALSAEAMAKIITDLAWAYGRSGDGQKLEVILPAAELETLGSGLKAALAEDLRNHTELLPGRDFSAGLKFGFSGSDVFLDFSDEALSELICEYIGPKLAAILKG